MNSYGGEFWDERYSSSEFVYGSEPNEFFKEQIQKLVPGKLLMIGEGEGRNAVFAAKQGWEVDAVDFSLVAKEKAIKLAKNNGVSINYDVSELSKYKFKQNYYDAAANIYLHLNRTLRKTIYSNCIFSLKTGGIIILEVFDKDQLGRNSGGPQNLEMLYSIDELKEDFQTTQIKLLEKKIITLGEGNHHKGEAAVVRMIAIKK